MLCTLKTHSYKALHTHSLISKAMKSSNKCTYILYRLCHILCNSTHLLPLDGSKTHLISCPCPSLLSSLWCRCHLIRSSAHSCEYLALIGLREDHSGVKARRRRSLTGKLGLWSVLVAADPLSPHCTRCIC